jgi:HEAT repeat protein
MKKSHLLVVAAAVLIGALASPLGAQESKPSGSKELTIEEMFLQNIEFQILRERAFSDDRELKMGVLDDLDKKITDGSIGDSKIQVEFVLEYLAMEGTTHTVREDGRLVNDFPDVRRRAANMLGKLGGPESTRALMTVLLSDNEPMVKAEAVYGLGVIGINDANETVNAIAFAFDREDPTKPDNNYAYAIVLAIEKLSQKVGGIKDPAAYRTLVKIAQGNYLRTVKNKALQVLETLKQLK